MKKGRSTIFKRVTNLIMNCEQATYLISKEFDIPLTFREKLWLRLHLVSCSFCRLFRIQAAFIHTHAHPDPSGEPMPAMSDAKKTSIENLIRPAGD